MKSENKNNIVMVSGIITKRPEFNHNVWGKIFYEFVIEVDRLSMVKDRLPVIIPEEVMKQYKFSIGRYVSIEGQYRSYNRNLQNGKRRLILKVFATSLLEINEVNVMQNRIRLVGTVCKQPIYRKTPLGREISEILIAVNRAYNKSDYIPAILWGNNARISETLEVGTRIKIDGRIQSRIYEKKLGDDISEKRIAYEVSVEKLERIMIS